MSVQFEVSIFEFEDAEVLERAADILMEQRRRDRCGRTREAVSRICRALQIEEPDESAFPPRSAAANVKSIEEMRNKWPELFRAKDQA